MKLLDESSSSSGSGSESDDDSQQPANNNLRINEKFASEFERRQRYKDLQRAKELLERDGLDDEDEDSESDESEDEDADLLSPDLDLKIIQTINQIRKKDPKIYDKTAKFFEEGQDQDDDEEDEAEDEQKGSSKDKKKKYKDVLREQLLQGGAQMEESEDEEGTGRKSRQLQTANKKQLVYDREQEELRKAFLKAANDDSDDNEEEDDDDANLLTVRKKSAADMAKEEAELKKALEEMKTLAAKEEADKEDFLTNYFANKMWKDSTSNKKKVSSGHDGDDDVDYDQDEEALEEAELFESKYNFRFEEMQEEKARKEGMNIIGLSDSNAYQVVGHARNVQGSLRREDESRKLQREQRKERKERERRQKEEELKRLKNLKKQELQERLSKIGEIGGLKQLGIDESFLDEDWDPSKHEALMQQQFNDDYYQDDDENFDVARIHEGLEDIVGDEIVGEEDEQEGEEEEEYYDEGDYGEEEAKDGRAHFASEEEYQAAKNAVKGMMDELYQLDYEDIVAGIPCRFKYKQVEPEDFGLTTEEILLADDADLNRFVSLKHIAPYNKKKWDKSERDIAKRRKRFRLALKEKLQEKGMLEEPSKSKQASEEITEKKAKKQQLQQEAAVSSSTAGEEQKQKRKRRKRKHDGSNDTGDHDHEGSDSIQEEAPAVISKATDPTYKQPKETSKTEDKKKFRDAKKKKNKKKEETDPMKKRLNLYK